MQVFAVEAWPGLVEESRGGRSRACGQQEVDLMEWWPAERAIAPPWAADKTASVSWAAAAVRARQLI